MKKENWAITWTLAVNDMKSRFAGSYLGIFWAFIQPIVIVLVYWFVFEVGFKDPGATGYPFVLFLVSGIIPWFFFTDALSGGASCFIAYSFLVKKVVFNIEVLPVVKVISSLFVHLFFVAFAIVLFAVYGYFPTGATLLCIYYIFCNIVLVVGMSFVCASVSVFFRDLIQFINVVVLQLGMWVTPIMWNAADMLANHPTILRILKLNPVYYIVDGFRDALLYQRFGLDHKVIWTLYFWVFTLLMLAFGKFVFNRLKPHFADIL